MIPSRFVAAFARVDWHRQNIRLRKILTAALVSTLFVTIGPALDVLTAPAASAFTTKEAPLNVAKNSITNDPFSMSFGVGSFAIYIELTNPASGQYLSIDTTFTNTNDFFGGSASNFTKAMFIGTQAEFNNTFNGATGKLHVTTGSTTNSTTTIRWKADPWNSTYYYATSNHHFYQMVAAANKAATDIPTPIFMGSTGYPATPTTSQENSDIVAAGTANSITSGTYWIGATDKDKEGVWRWNTTVDGSKAFYIETCVNNSSTNLTIPTTSLCSDTGAHTDSVHGGNYTSDGLNYSNWAAGEPNNSYNTSGEDYATIIMDSNNRGYWNDLYTSNAPTGYVIEWGNAVNGFAPGDYSEKALISFVFSTGYSALTTTYGTSVFSTTPATSGGRASISYSIANSGHTAVSINSSTGVVTLSTSATADDNGLYTVTATENSATAGDAATTTTTISVNVSKLTLTTPGSYTVTATSGTSKSINVSWTDVSNESSYTLTLLESATVRATISLSANTTTKTITTSDYSGLADNTSYTVTLVAVGNATQYETSTAASSTVTTNQVPRIATFDSGVRKSLGFTVGISNYDNTFTYETATSSAGSVSFSNGTFTVTGLTKGQGATVTISTRKSGFVSTTTTSGTYYALDTPTALSLNTRTLTAERKYKILYSADASNPNIPTYTSTTSSVCTVSGETITSLTAGTCTINASLAGYGIYDTATATRSFTVNSALTITINNNPILWFATTATGRNFNVSGGVSPYTYAIVRTSDSATITGFSISGSYIYVDSLTPVSADTYTVIATDANGDSIHGFTYIQINKGTPTFTFTQSVTSTTAGSSVTFTVTATKPLVTGTITLKENSGVTTTYDGCTDVPLVNGSMTCTWIAYSGGATGIQLRYSGDSNYIALNSSPANITVSAPATVVYSSPITLTYGIGGSFKPTSITNGTTVAGTPWTWSIIRESDSQTVTGISMTSETITVASTTAVGTYLMRVYSTDSAGSTTSRTVTITINTATGLTPIFGAATRTDGGFTFDITNYDSNYTFTPSVTAGSISVGTANGSILTVIVTGLSDSTTATATITTSRTNYTSPTATRAGTSLGSGLTPIFGTITKVAGGFSVSITNYSASYTWTESVTAGTVLAGTPSGSTRTYTITGLTAGQSVTLYVTDTSTTTKPLTASFTGASLANQSPITVTSTSGVYPNAPLTISGSSGSGALSYSIPGPATSTISGSQISETITTGAYGVSAAQALYSPDGTMLYILNPKSTGSNLLRFVISSNSFTTPISLPANSNQMAMDPNGNYILVVSTTQVTKILTSTGETSTVISSGLSAGKGIVIDPTGTGDFYVTDNSNHKIFGFYTNGSAKFTTTLTTNSAGKSTAFGRMAIIADGTKFYSIGTTTGGNKPTTYNDTTLYEFSSSTGATLRQILSNATEGDGFTSLDITPNGKYAFAGNSRDGRIYSFNLMDGTSWGGITLYDQYNVNGVTVAPNSAFVMVSTAQAYNGQHIYQYSTSTQGEGSSGNQVDFNAAIYGTPAGAAIAPNSKTGYLLYSIGIVPVNFAWGEGTAHCSISGTTISAKSEGTCSVTATRAADADYLVETSTVTTFTFSAATAPRVTAVGKTVYYAPTSLYTASAVVSGLVGSDTATVNSASYSYQGINGTNYASSTNKPTAVGTYSVTPTFSNFTLTSFSTGYRAGYARPTTFISDTLTVLAKVPDTPTAVSASVLSSTSARVTFTAPVNNGGSTITKYIVTNLTDTNTAEGTSSPITLTGLTPGATYIFKVVAINATGQSDSGTAASITLPLTVVISPSTTSAIYGVPITTIIPTVTGGSGVTYAVTPALPAGLTLNSNGSITGTPTETSTVKTYTETATATGGALGTATFTLSVAKATSAITAPSVTPLSPVIGSTNTFSATVTSNTQATLTGTISFRNGSNVLLCSTDTITAGVGSCDYTPLTTDTFTVRSYYSGMTYVDSATSTTFITLVPSRANPSVTLTSTTTRMMVNATATLTTTIVTGSATAATGQVAYTANGTAISGCGAVNVATNVATCAFTPTAAGSYSIIATYVGDANFNGAAASSITITASSCTQSYSGLTLDTGTPAAGYCAVAITAGTSGSYGLPAGVTSMTTKIMIIGGGGSGGTRAGAGGGAGSLIYGDSILISDTRTVTIGAGAVGKVATNHGENGVATTFGTYIAAGGGGGANNATSTGNSGGSGGGGAGNSGGTAGSGSQTAYTGFTAYVHSGGVGTSGSNGPAWTGGGGGGAGDIGLNGVSGTRGGYGGAGLAMNMTLDGSYACFAAGGGGGADYPKVGGTGGACTGNSTAQVGGSGSAGGTSPNAGNGVANTGSGGGGGGFGVSGDDQVDTGYAGSGGSGLVAIRYISAPTISVPSDTSTVSLAVVTFVAIVPTFGTLFTRTYQWQFWDSATAAWANDTVTASARTLTYTFTAHYNGVTNQKFRLLVTDSDGSIQTTSASRVINLSVSRIAQPTLIVATQYAVSGTTLNVFTSGGAGKGAVTFTYVAAGSTAGCTLATNQLNISGGIAGTCKVVAAKAADGDYLAAVSDTATVTFILFEPTTQVAPTNQNTGIAVTEVIPFTKGSDACSSNCVPSITAVRNTSGTDITSLTVGSQIRLIGLSFNTTTGVFFYATIDGVYKRKVAASSFTVDSDTQLTVTPPASFTPNTGEASSAITVGISVQASGGLSGQIQNIVTISR